MAMKLSTARSSIGGIHTKTGRGEFTRRNVVSFASSQKEGKGVYALDGKMIDMRLLKNGQKVLDRAKAAGRI